jgi:hypothetical protein
MSDADNRRVQQLQEKVAEQIPKEKTKAKGKLTQRKNVGVAITTENYQESVQLQQEALIKASQQSGKEAAQIAVVVESTAFLQEQIRLRNQFTNNLTQGMLNTARESQNKLLEQLEQYNSNSTYLLEGFIEEDEGEELQIAFFG